jgi:hypothetical protein
LKNPRYTGAFVYGRTQTRRLPGGRELRRQLPRERWHTVILGAHPGYISWEDYEQNLARLHENAQANGAECRKSPPREGPALLQGLAVCAARSGASREPNGPVRGCWGQTSTAPSASSSSRR